MEGHRFLVCCVLVLIITIYELGGATAYVVYKFNPLTAESKNAIDARPYPLHIKFFLKGLLDENEANEAENPISLTFNVTTLSESLSITTSVKVSALLYLPVAYSASVGSGGDRRIRRTEFEYRSIEYRGHLNVSVTADTRVLTGDLHALLSCNHEFCTNDNDERKNKNVVIVKETKTLHVTATPSYDVSQTSPTTNVTVTLSKDLATLENITISVSLHDKDPQGHHYSNQSVLASDADSSSDVVFTNIQWGDYQLTIGCGNNSVCSALSQWIDFPDPVSVAAHPSYSNLSAIIFGLKEQLADCSTSTVATKAPVTTPSIPTTKPPSIPSSADATTTATDATAGSSSQTTLYMEFAVGGLIAALVCGLLGYLLYHYRTKVKEWICSKKVVVSNLPIARKLRRNAGSRYSKLPRTMQEALHQD